MTQKIVEKYDALAQSASLVALFARDLEVLLRLLVIVLGVAAAIFGWWSAIWIFGTWSTGEGPQLQWIVGGCCLLLGLVGVFMVFRGIRPVRRGM